MKVWLTFLVLLLAPPIRSFPSASSHLELLPVDEGPNDNSFRIFRDTLFKAASQRDTAFVKSVLAANVLAGFGGEQGVSMFISVWQLESQRSKFWRELTQVLKMGGTFARTEKGVLFCAPYVYSTFPNDLDPYSYVAAIHKNVPVLAAPNISARVIRRLSYDIVPLVNTRDQLPESWIAIRTASGQIGFVAASDVRSPIDTRACFQRLGGKWRMVAFVSGD